MPCVMVPCAGNFPVHGNIFSFSLRKLKSCGILGASRFS
jgi:hypothetical protein